MKNRLFCVLVAFSLLFILSRNSLTYGQTGAGGVGSSTNNVLWLAADKGVTLTSGLVSAWADQSGNSNNAAPAASTNSPTYVSSSVNGYPSFDFDGTDDELRVPDNATLDLTQWHIFIVVIADAQKNYNAWLVKGNDGTENYEMLSYNDGNIHTPIRYTDATRTSPSSAASQVTTTDFNIFEYSYVSTVGRDVYKNNGATIITDNEAKTPTVNAFDLYIGNEKNTTGRFINGDIAEIVVYNAPLNSAQRIIVNNYLAAKYNRTLTNNDVYDEDNSGFDHDVAGIGRVNSSNIQSDSRGSGIVRILNPTGLGDNEFFIWGHDNGDISATNTSDVPAGVQARSNRIWRISERNTTNASAVDVGNVDVRFDLTGLGSVTASDLRLLIDTDNDGVFSDETPVSGATLVSGNIYEFAGVSGTSLADNIRFTIATINSSQTPLPVSLVSFNAICHLSTAELSWKTKSEVNNDYFLVERSADGIHWQVVAKINGAGNSSVELNYSFSDSSTPLGTRYYRLKQVDRDGNFEYFDLLTVNCDDQSKVQVYPVPSNDHITVISQEEIESIMIFASDGRLIKTVSGNSTYSRFIEIDDLSEGIYFLAVYSKTGSQLIQILVD